MAATFVIFLREGIEASMIVAILLAYLARIDQRKYFADVFAGVGAALALAAGGGVAAYYFVRQYDGSRAQTIFETATYALAAAVLTYMTFWMRNHSRTISHKLQERTEEALTRGARRGLRLLAFQAVGREGLETVVFTLAIVFSASAHAALIGGGVGLAAALVLAYFIYHLGKRLNFAVFFKVVGVLLMAFAAGLVVDIVEDLQQLGWLPFLHQTLWDTTGVLSENSAFGDVIHSFAGYVSRPTPLEAIAWGVYLLATITSYLGLWSRLRRRGTSGAVALQDGAMAEEAPAATPEVATKA